MPSPAAQRNRAGGAVGWERPATVSDDSRRHAPHHHAERRHPVARATSSHGRPGRRRDARQRPEPGITQRRSARGAESRRYRRVAISVTAAMRRTPRIAGKGRAGVDGRVTEAVDIGAGRVSSAARGNTDIGRDTRPNRRKPPWGDRHRQDAGTGRTHSSRAAERWFRAGSSARALH